MYDYNVKLIEYRGSYEVKHYRNPIRLLEDDDKERRVRKRQNTEKEKLDYNPFTGKEEKRPFDTSEEMELKFQGRSLDNSYKRTKQCIYSYARANNWEWFFTITFAEQKYDRSDYKKLASTVNDWFSYIRKKYAPGLKYLIVPEFHSDGINYHFHGLMANCGNLEFTYSGIIKKGRMIYNLVQYKKGFATFSKVESVEKACAYVCKYVTKELVAHTKNRKRYWVSRNLEKPVETCLSMPDDEVEILLDSLGDVDYAKSMGIEYLDGIEMDNVVKYNSCKIYQINKT